MGRVVTVAFDKQFLLRVDEEQLERWREYASNQGVSLSEWARSTLDAEFIAATVCTHEHKRTYDWSVTCLDCGERLS